MGQLSGKCYYGRSDRLIGDVDCYTDERTVTTQGKRRITAEGSDAPVTSSIKHDIAIVFRDPSNNENIKQFEFVTVQTSDGHTYVAQVNELEDGIWDLTTIEYE